MNDEDAKYGTWIQTFTGKIFDLSDPKPENVDIVDIAHALGMLCRYCGHVKKFYSVAEHCVVMSRIVSPEAALDVLLHDSPEAYVTDISRPIKSLLPNHAPMEARVLSAIYEYLELDLPSESIKKEIELADLTLYLTEREQLMAKPPKPWVCDDGRVEALPTTLPLWSPEIAETAYLERFNALIRREQSNG